MSADIFHPTKTTKRVLHLNPGGGQYAAIVGITRETSRTYIPTQASLERVKRIIANAVQDGSIYIFPDKPLPAWMRTQHPRNEKRSTPLPRRTHAKK
jgi:hypothetical protein